MVRRKCQNVHSTQHYACFVCGTLNFYLGVHASALQNVPSTLPCNTAKASENVVGRDSRKGKKKAFVQEQREGWRPMCTWSWQKLASRRAKGWRGVHRDAGTKRKTGGNLDSGILLHRTLQLQVTHLVLGCLEYPQSLTSTTYPTGQPLQSISMFCWMFACIFKRRAL